MKILVLFLNFAFAFLSLLSEVRKQNLSEQERGPIRSSLPDLGRIERESTVNF